MLEPEDPQDPDGYQGANKVPDQVGSDRRGSREASEIIFSVQASPRQIFV